MTLEELETCNWLQCPTQGQISTDQNDNDMLKVKSVIVKPLTYILNLAGCFSTKSESS